MTMNRRDFIAYSVALSAAGPLAALPANAEDRTSEVMDTILVVDTDRVTTPIDQRIYGQFLEHINHSVEDGLFAEQIRGAGFEGDDYKTYWEPVAERGQVELVDTAFRNGSKSVRLTVNGGHSGLRQRRIFVEAGVKYDGSLWAKREGGAPQLKLDLKTSKGEPIASATLPLADGGWQEIPFSFASAVRDTQALIEITATGHGALLLDFVSMMRADVRRDGMLRPDLLQALQGLGASFIRWPGGSFASTYNWKEGIGPYSARGYHPNTYWGGYSDYFGFGTDEFLGLCRKLNSEPLITLPAPGTGAEQLEYAMDWVRYVNDPPGTPMAKLRAANGHPEPYGVKYFQIDNEPMNNGFTPEKYAEIVNVYGAKLRSIDPKLRIIACGQKRSNDMDWSEKVIDLAGDNFDILGCHNYEYEPDNFATGIRRIGNYLSKLRDYIRISQHPNIEIGVLEWSLQHTYDWRAGLHAAGSLMMYEELSPTLTMTCPALLMRNTTDDPKWTSAIYHDHVSWFPGGSYPVEKLFREHFAEQYLASAAGAVRNPADRKLLFDKISTAVPEGWQDGSVDAIATASSDLRRIVIKAVNYSGQMNSLLIRLQGKLLPAQATVEVHTITAGLKDTASLEHPNAIAPKVRSVGFAKDMTVDLDPYTVAVVVIRST